MRHIVECPFKAKKHLGSLGLDRAGRRHQEGWNGLDLGKALEAETEKLSRFGPGIPLSRKKSAQDCSLRAMN
jgi:hypothetical protein